MDTPSSTGLLYLWDRRTFFLGVLSDPRHIFQAAAILTVSLDGPFRVQHGNPSQEIVCRSLLLAAGQEAHIDSGNAMIAMCFLDPFGQDYASLSAVMTQVRDGIYVQLPEEQRFQEIFADVLRETPTPDPLYAILDQLFHQRGDTPLAVDPRVVQVVELIKRSITVNLLVEDLADAVELSAPRLIQLFKRQIGVPIRRYRQWHRVYVTAVGVAGGKSLTEAALSAGFTDSSHFSNTFRTMVGMKPSSVLSHLERIRIFAPARPELDASLAAPRPRAIE
ncbi:AraC family transcriptional regulator [Allohahella marinimesophila]|uniref:Helix-turn-helix domain-containing protein n=1 Tax=Allohahella marinimesophila TaxID=1054972 RepID=A0ABP7NYN8_9GAMM